VPSLLGSRGSSPRKIPRPPCRGVLPDRRMPPSIAWGLNASLRLAAPSLGALALRGPLLGIFCKAKKMLVKNQQGGALRAAPRFAGPRPCEEKSRHKIAIGADRGPAPRSAHTQCKLITIVPAGHLQAHEKTQ